MWTDDTQLTLAIANSLIERGDIDLDDIAKKHVEAMMSTTIGWGRSTKNSVQRIKDGAHWSVSGEKGGAGNGVAMKIAPIGAYLFARYLKMQEQYAGPEFAEKWMEFYEDVYSKVTSISLMTHRTRLGIASGLAQVEATFAGLMGEKKDRFPGFFINGALTGSVLGEARFILAGEEKDELSERMEEIKTGQLYRYMSIPQLAEKFGGGTCYAYNSVPFSYAAFLTDPRSIDTLYDVASAGGDTDSNASIVGGLLGAFNGTKIFPQHLIDGLWRKDEIMKTAEEFCNKFFRD